MNVCIKVCEAVPEFLESLVPQWLPTIEIAFAIFRGCCCHNLRYLSYAPRSFVRNKIKRTQTVSYLITNFPLYFWCLKMRWNFNWLTLIKGKKQKIWNETTKPTREIGKLVLFCRKLYVLVALNIFISRKRFKSLWTPTLLSLSMKTARARLQRTGISLNFVKTLIG